MVFGEKMLGDRQRQAGGYWSDVGLEFGLGMLECQAGMAPGCV